MAYATPDDVYQGALSAQAFIVVSRPVDAIDRLTATVRLKAHGLMASDTVTLEVTDGGELPTGMSEFTAYQPIRVSADLLQFAESGVTFTSWASPGLGWGISVDPLRRLLWHLDDRAAVIDEHLTAHSPPIPLDPTTGRYPPILIGLNARMAARAAVISLQLENAEFKVATDRLFALEEQDLKMLADWKSGKPMLPRPVDADSIADNSARAWSLRDPIPWNPGTL
jgi:hypothetical protein